MRLQGLLIILVVLLLFSGCADTSVKTYFATYEEAAFVVGFVQEKSLMVLVLPQSLLEKARIGTISTLTAVEDLIGMKMDAVYEGSSDRYYQMQELATTLVVNTTDIEDRNNVDGLMRLEALGRGAGYLRKTGLTDTLATVAGFEDPFDNLKEFTQFQVIDLTDVLKSEDYTDWDRFKTAFAYYVEELLRYQRRSYSR